MIGAIFYKTGFRAALLVTAVALQASGVIGYDDLWSCHSLMGGSEVASVSTKEIEIVAVKEAEQAGSKEAGKTPKMRWGAAAAGTFTTNLFRSNIILHILLKLNVDPREAELIAGIINTVLAA